MKGFVDLHTHILPRTDDGIKTTKESLKYLQNASKLGFQTIVLTPHYIVGVNKDYQTNLKEFRRLKKKVSKKRLKIELLLANEVMLDAKILTNLAKNKIVPINNSRYILIEIPLYINEKNIENSIYKLKAAGLIPIIAHPERNLFFQKDLTKLHKLFNLGVIFQINAGSYGGFYGKKAMSVFQYMVANNLVHLVASDAHSASDIKYLSKILKFFQKKYSQQAIDLLFKENPLRILNDEAVMQVNLVKQKSWLARLKKVID